MMDRLAALLVAPVLMLLPFLLFAGGDAHHGGATPHADHAPRHGGRLVMIGDHHVELVERNGTVALYLSDAVRRPLAPAGGRAVRGDGSATRLEFEGDHLVARAPVTADAERYEIAVGGGPVLTLPAR